MERAKARLPFHQLLRHIEPGTDPDTLTAGPTGRRGAANGLVDAQLPAVSGPGAAARFGSGTDSPDPTGPENDTRHLTGSGPHGRLARTVFLLIFMAILFLSGIFIGASLIVSLPNWQPPAAGGVSVPIPAPLAMPAPGSSTAAAPPPEPVAPQ